MKIGGASALDSQVKGQKGWSIEDNLTLDGIQWAGDHTIKMGVKYKQIDLYASDAAQINPTFTYSLGDPDFPDSIPYKAQFVKPVTGVTGVSGEVRSKSKQYGVFIQDDWQVNDHLQLNIGLRWDYEKTPSYLDFVTPQQVVDAIYSQDPRAPPARPMPIRWHWAAWTLVTTSATVTTARHSRMPGSRAWASRMTSMPTSST